MEDKQLFVLTWRCSRACRRNIKRTCTSGHIPHCFYTKFDNNSCSAFHTSGMPAASTTTGEEDRNNARSPPSPRHPSNTISSSSHLHPFFLSPHVRNHFGVHPTSLHHHPVIYLPSHAIHPTHPPCIHYNHHQPPISQRSLQTEGCKCG